MKVAFNNNGFHAEIGNSQNDELKKLQLFWLERICNGTVLSMLSLIFSVLSWISILIDKTIGSLMLETFNYQGLELLGVGTIVIIFMSLLLIIISLIFLLTRKNLLSNGRVAGFICVAFSFVITVGALITVPFVFFKI